MFLSILPSQPLSFPLKHVIFGMQCNTPPTIQNPIEMFTLAEMHYYYGVAADLTIWGSLVFSPKLLHMCGSRSAQVCIFSTLRTGQATQADDATFNSHIKAQCLQDHIMITVFYIT